MKITTQASFNEKNRNRNEMLRIMSAVKEQTEQATEWLNTRDGKRWFKKTVKEFVKDENMRWKIFKKERNEDDAEDKGRMKEIKKRNAMKQSLLNKEDATRKKLMAEMTNLEQKMEGELGWKAEEMQGRIDEILEQLETGLLDEDETEILQGIVEAEEQEEEEEDARAFQKAMDGGETEEADNEFRKHMKQSKSKRWEIAREKVRSDYIEEQCEAARFEIQEEFRKMRTVARNWQYMYARICFENWANWTYSEIETRKLLAEEAEKQAKLDAEAAEANLALKKAELEKWEKLWDEWHDLWYWKHAETGKTTYDEPNIDSVEFVTHHK